MSNSSTCSSSSATPTSRELKQLRSQIQSSQVQVSGISSVEIANAEQQVSPSSMWTFEQLCDCISSEELFRRESNTSGPLKKEAEEILQVLNLEEDVRNPDKRPVSGDSVLKTSDEVKEILRIPELQESRPDKVDATLGNNFSERNFDLLSPFLDVEEFEAIQKQIDAEYGSFNPQFTTTRKNKHRAFWSERIVPVLMELDPLFHRIAILGSLNGLTPQTTRKFYSLLKYVAYHKDALEVQKLLEACLLVSVIGEYDPALKLYPAMKSH